jgi:hypothetical protein
MMEIPVSVLSSTISRGDILLSDFEGINHRKFFIIMGISEQSVCGYFFINSNIARYILGKQELLALQYTIKHEDYDFLKYDSFVCASDVKEIPLSVIVEGIKENKVEIKGHLKEKHIEDILEIVNQSKAIKAIHKKLYFK